MTRILGSWSDGPWPWKLFFYDLKVICPLLRSKHKMRMYTPALFKSIERFWVNYTKWEHFEIVAFLFVPIIFNASMTGQRRIEWLSVEPTLRIMRLLRCYISQEITIVTRKSCLETNTKTALRYRSTTILKLWYMMVMWSMRMQKFIDQLSFFFKWPTGNHFGFLYVKFVMSYPCVRHYIFFFIHGPVILHFLS